MSEGLPALYLTCATAQAGVTEWARRAIVNLVLGQFHGRSSGRKACCAIICSMSKRRLQRFGALEIVVLFGTFLLVYRQLGDALLSAVAAVFCCAISILVAKGVGWRTVEWRRLLDIFYIWPG